MMSRISLWILKLFGWKLTGEFPRHLPKVMLGVAPHTSNWDFVVGVLARSATRIKVTFVGKHTLFVFPLGILMRGLGGIPVDRRSKGNFVEKTIDAINKQASAHLVMSVEGTRKKVDRLRTGFYYIAKGAGMPIQLVKFDWAKKEVNYGEIFYPTDNEKADIEYIWNYFKGVRGYNPELGIL